MTLFVALETSHIFLASVLREIEDRAYNPMAIRTTHPDFKLETTHTL